MKLAQALLVMVVGLAMSATANAACSNATFQGPYGLLLTGANTSGLTAVVGQVIADGTGGVTGTETFSINGAISSNVAFTGTYSINSSCTGNARITASGFPVANFSLSVVATGKQIDMVETDAGTAVTGYGLTRGTSVCTAAAIKGTFGFQGGGALPGLVPNAFAGQVKLDGVSTLTGTETASSGGVIVSGAVSGTYTVNSNCTGTVSVSFNGVPANFNFVIVNGDQTALEIRTDAGTVVTNITAKR